MLLFLDRIESITLGNNWRANIWDKLQTTHIEEPQSTFRRLLTVY